MNRPYIFCHMQVSLDGKIIGKYMDISESKGSGDFFYDVAFGKNAHYKHQGWLSGRTTTDDNFTHYKKPELDEQAPAVPEGDFVAEPTGNKYYISIDTSGKLGWTQNTLQYGDTTAEVLEVLTEKVSNAYKAFLREKNISYVIAGKESLDMELLLQKLKDVFHMNLVMLGGGGVLNWSFIQAGLCDEVSVVIAPAADASATSPSLFDTKENLTDDIPVSFTLKNVETKEDSTVWLTYSVNNAETK
ncbi:dihydrofolate reductase family protein [Tetragenococcus koreensis]|uniref:dihydrofolate reductase family protein n=1 Tax=Tetragenococcus koreensis TaxID=290335 RepID=UPI001F3115E7|nr:RibD family protein [Tetragenococcus koreensis]MCF1618000.1 RibD family protein [Tetragenococcus koreensis]MCF1622851.1 RibD family protein [Tetragenococcus koreensis]MCF1626255.1 RibD family protein [Tetragenococcus koreensis]MCF1630813.1 RibD family protein [Tetragenococcus koreensis]MCF1679126.1 RibD family protein [Tetragenococcus koreensis]